jgi:glutathione-regulated potassium-efflux system protein KefB
VLGDSEDEARQLMEDIRSRDQERFALELAEGIDAGVGMMHGNAGSPAPHH